MIAAEILDAARRATADHDAPLVEIDGWRGRTNRSGPTPRGSVVATMMHDTVTGANVSRHRLGTLLRDGYPGLPGPIANGGLDRDGALLLVSVPAANHAGSGGGHLDVGADRGNPATFGLEVANRGLGSGERWTGMQYDVAVAFAAYLADNLGRPRQRALTFHRIYARGRKVDPWAPDYVTMLRHVVGYRASATPPPPSGSDLEEFLVSLTADQRRTLETLATLTPEQAREVRSFARTIERRDSSGMGVANAAIDDQRQRLEVGFDGSGYQAVADLVATVEEFGSGVRGLVAGSIAALRQLRGARLVDRSPARFHENRLYTVDEAAVR